MELLYYGQLRDAIGRDREAVDPPSHVLTVEDLIGWLRKRGEPHASALAAASPIRAAIAGDWSRGEDSVFGAVEVALLPRVGVL